MERPRIDLWLKFVCLVRHRSEATEACSGGHVRINEKRAKPASPVQVDDVVELTGDHYRKVVVLGIPQRQMSKPEARAMYRDETPEQPRQHTGPAGLRERGSGRPTKKQRRELDRWRR